MSLGWGAMGAGGCCVLACAWQDTPSCWQALACMESYCLVPPIIAGAWGKDDQIRADPDSDSELGDGPASKAPSQPAPHSPNAAATLPPGAIAAAAASSSKQQDSKPKKNIFGGGGPPPAPPSAYPSAGMFAAENTNAAYEGPSSPEEYGVRAV